MAPTMARPTAASLWRGRWCFLAAALAALPLADATAATQLTVLALAGSSKAEPDTSLDFWMGLLLRFLTVVALALAVVEVELPLCEKPAWLPDLTEGGKWQGYATIPSGDDLEKSRRRRPHRGGGGQEEDDFTPPTRGGGEEEDDVTTKLLSSPVSVVEGYSSTTMTTVRTKGAEEEASQPERDGRSAMVESLVLILLYMGAAIGIVYLNAWILRKWPFAATLTMFQMIFCSLAARGCVWLELSDPTKVGMTPVLYATTCLPLSIFYTFYLYGSNAVYDYLPVGYIQLLKPGQAAAVYVLLALAGKEIVAAAPVLNLAVILGSVVVASVANAEVAGWSTYGFALMMGSNCAYALYLVGQQLLLNTQLGGSTKKMDSITTLYFLGPATAVCLALVALATEWTSPKFTLRGLNGVAVAADCAIAFSLNLIQIRIIGRLSALTYMFAGYVKGFITVAIAVLFLHEPASALEIGGYLVMLFGQLLWSLRKLRTKAASSSTADDNNNGPLLSENLDPQTKVANFKIKLAAAAAVLALTVLYALAFDRCIIVPCVAASTI